jgi:hypothetical protein
METNVKLGQEITGLELVMCNCNECPDPDSALKRLRSAVRFLDPRPKNPDRTDKHPELRRRESDGSIIVPLTITHPAFGLECSALSAGWKIGIGRLTYLAKSQSVSIMQTNSPEGETTEEMATGLAEVAKDVCPAIAPAYSWVDVSTEKLRPRLVKRFSDVKHWFFANIFSPKLLAGAPEGFLDKIPAAERMTLKDGSLLLKSTATFEEWYLSPPKKLSTYLAKHAPQITIFRQ